jgi:hypothetical protein
MILMGVGDSEKHGEIVSEMWYCRILINMMLLGGQLWLKRQFIPLTMLVLQ